MIELKKEEYYEHINYRELLKLRPDSFYLHLPLQLPFLKWLFEMRLEFLLLLGINTNYFGMRHVLDPQTQWFSDWIFLNHYYFDYLGLKKWKPTLIDRFRYRWLMWQGYGREHKSYFALRKRKEEKNVTVQERKFLSQYIECIYRSYIDSQNDDELAFFRLGLDSDEYLDKEEKPLFPNIAYSYSDDPMLAYMFNKTMITEHIPKSTSRIAKLIARRRIMARWKYNKKVTYADMRVMFNPDTTKIHDIEFILHSFDKHDGPPENIEENKLYTILYPLYQREIEHIAKSMHIPELEKMNIASPRRKLNPLYVAYKQRWFGVNPVTDFQKVFHGVTYEEYQEIVNQQYDHLERKKRKKSKKNKSRAAASKKVDESIIKASKKR